MGLSFFLRKNNMGYNEPLRKESKMYNPFSFKKEIEFVNRVDTIWATDEDYREIMKAYGRIITKKILQGLIGVGLGLALREILKRKTNFYN